jgi:hypothetical protein
MVSSDFFGVVLDLVVADFIEVGFALGFCANNPILTKIESDKNIFFIY